MEATATESTTTTTVAATTAAEEEPSTEVKEIIKPVDPDDIFGQIGRDDVTNVQKILRKNKDVVNTLDEHGMTPLQHSAYKGNKELCQILFDYVSRFI
jgi:hypothetical protein